MQQGIPTEETVLEYFNTLSNWGRWGAEDQLGTLNFLTPEKTRRAVGLVREGVTISCARTIRYDAGPDSPAPAAPTSASRMIAVIPRLGLL